MSADLVAGVDIATATVRVQVHDAGGARVAAASRTLATPVRSAGGRSEQDASAWWPAVRDCLTECTAQLGSRSGDITALAISATSGTVALVDGDGRARSPALMYDDDRETADVSAALSLGDRRWRRSGITPSAGIARMSWLAHRDRDADTRLCHVPDLVATILVGHPVATDSSHALKNGYDAVAGQWAVEVFERLGVDEELLPPVVPPTTVLGTVDGRAAEATGLPEGCQVRAGMTDGCAGQLASGAARIGEFVTVLGTTMVLKGVSREVVSDHTGAVYSHQHPAGWWLPGGAANVGGAALSDVDPGELAALDEAAEVRGPSSVVQYPLHVRGERFPFRTQRARRFTLGVPHDRVDEYRSRLEGVAFCERLALQRMGQLGAEVVGAVRTAGGGARSRAWCRIRASVLGRPVLRVESAGTPLGAAMLAASGSLHPDLATAAAEMAPPAELIEPVAAETAQLDESYARFVGELSSRGWAESSLVGQACPDRQQERLA